jgi:uncharacterized membrane protein YfcA
VPGLLAGTALGQAVSGGALIAAFAVIMLLTAVAIWRKARQQGTVSQAETGAPTCPPLQLSRSLAAGLLIGVMTGFFGVGGGFLIVPTLAIALALALRLAVGTSLIIITATSLMALAAHLATGRTLDIPLTAAMALACVAGALAGSRLASHLPQRQLGTGFAALVALVATYLLISAAFFGGPPATS